MRCTWHARASLPAPFLPLGSDSSHFSDYIFQVIDAAQASLGIWPCRGLSNQTRLPDSITCGYCVQVRFCLPWLSGLDEQRARMVAVSYSSATRPAIHSPLCLCQFGSWVYLSFSAYQSEPDKDRTRYDQFLSLKMVLNTDPPQSSGHPLPSGNNQHLFNHSNHAREHTIVYCLQTPARLAP